ncbi:MAG: hypothetical protein LBC20_18740 [Planctomycetaceae bacterium]|nr:hypothetical protein [Planctomycetaceae bacterium]
MRINRPECDSFKSAYTVNAQTNIPGQKINISERKTKPIISSVIKSSEYQNAPLPPQNRKTPK